MGVLAEYGNYLATYQTRASFVMNWGAKTKPEGNKIIETVQKEKRKFLFEHEAKQLLKLHGAPVSLDVLAQTEDEAVNLAHKIAAPVALKIVSPDILHKSDAGGVKINLSGENQIRTAFKEIMQNAKSFDPKAKIKGILVSPMAKVGIEVIIGTKIDDQFGPIIMYGLGGVMVEILKDVSFRVLPISPSAARRMIEETKSFPILDGVRGGPESDKKALRKLLLLCSEIIEAYPQIEEMDLNPVIVHEQGLSIVDARIILKE
jgi:acetyltransferase